MNGAQLGYISVIVTIFAGLAGVYYLARQSAREQERQRQAVIDGAVKAAKDPLITELKENRLLLRDKDLTIRERERRIEQLEDELRRGRT